MSAQSFSCLLFYIWLLGVVSHNARANKPPSFADSTLLARSIPGLSQRGHQGDDMRQDPKSHIVATRCKVLAATHSKASRLLGHSHRGYRGDEYAQGEKNTLRHLEARIDYRHYPCGYTGNSTIYLVSTHLLPPCFHLTNMSWCGSAAMGRYLRNTARDSDRQFSRPSRFEVHLPLSPLTESRLQPGYREHIHFRIRICMFSKFSVSLPSDVT